MPNKLNILVTDGDYKHTLGILRNLAMEGHNVYTLNNKKRTLSGASRFCKKAIVTCDWNDTANEKTYISQVKHYCNEYGIDLIIPVGFLNCILMSKYKKELMEVSKIIVADYEKIDFALDKSKVLKFAEKLGVGIPKTFYPKKLSEINVIADSLTFPCVIKSRFEHGANVVTYPQNKDELKQLYKKLVAQHGFKNESLPMIQEYITGDGYAFFALYIDGNCKQIFMHHRIREFPVTGGASVKAEAFYDKALMLIGRKLLDALEWHGVAMVEFKMDSKGDYKLMEINPKYWGSTDLALVSGAEFPSITARYVMGENIGYSEEYNRNTQFHWPFDGDWLHAIYNPKNIGAVLVDCFNPKVKSNWWWRDFKVNLLLFSKLVKSVGKVLLRK